MHLSEQISHEVDRKAAGSRQQPPRRTLNSARAYVLAPSAWRGSQLTTSIPELPRPDSLHPSQSLFRFSQSVAIRWRTRSALARPFRSSAPFASETRRPAPSRAARCAPLPPLVGRGERGREVRRLDRSGHWEGRGKLEMEVVKEWAGPERGRGCC